MKTVIACAIVAALSVYATLEQYYRTDVINERFPDPYLVGAAQARYGGAAAMLPADAIVGYVSNRKLNNAEGGAMFFGAQYVLAPRILVDWDKVDKDQFVLGNFPPARDVHTTVEQSGKLYGLRVERDFGDGVVLYRKGILDQ